MLQSAQHSSACCSPSFSPHAVYPAMRTVVANKHTRGTSKQHCRAMQLLKCCDPVAILALVPVLVRSNCTAHYVYTQHSPPGGSQVLTVHVQWVGRAPEWLWCCRSLPVVLAEYHHHVHTRPVRTCACTRAHCLQYWLRVRHGLAAQRAHRSAVSAKPSPPQCTQPPNLVKNAQPCNLRALPTWCQST